jgi:hypothetical protein
MHVIMYPSVNLRLAEAVVSGDTSRHVLTRGDADVDEPPFTLKRPVVGERPDRLRGRSSKGPRQSASRRVTASTGMPDYRGWSGEARFSMPVPLTVLTPAPISASERAHRGRPRQPQGADR